MAEQFYTILTKVGKAKIANAAALGTKVNLTKFQVGDGRGSYYNPTEDQTQLRNKVWESNISSITIDKQNLNWIVLEVIIPGNVGGFMIREAGVFDDEGNLIAIGKYPETYKPTSSDGSTKDLLIKMILEVSNASSVTLKVDPTVIFATKKDIEILENKIENVESQLSDIETGSITTEDRVFSLKDSTGGYGKVSIEGNTLVNLIKVSDWYKDSQSTYRINNPPIKTGTDYTAIIPKFEKVKFAIYNETGTSPIVAYQETNILKFNTNEAKVRIYVQSTDESAINISSITPILLEGDWTNKPVPEYFEGIKSFGESDNPEILSCGKNLINLNNLNGVEILPNNSYKKSGWASLLLNAAKVNTIFKPNTKYYVKAKYTLNKVSNLPVCSYQVGFNLHSTDSSTYFAVTNTLQKVGDVCKVNTHFTTPPDLKERELLFYTNRYTDNNSDVEYGEVTVENLIISETPIDNYESYKQDKIDILKPLCGLPGGVRDTRDSNGTITKRVGKVVLDGSLGYGDFTTDTNTVRVYYHNNGIQNSDESIINCIADKLNGIPNLFLTDVEGVMIGNNSNNIWIRVNKNELETVDVQGLKKYLNANPITVYYPLAEPIIEQADPLQLQTFHSGTIAINSVIPTKITIEYPKNIKGQINSNSNAITATEKIIENVKKDVITAQLDANNAQYSADIAQERADYAADKAEEAFQFANNGKIAVANAVTAKGVSASPKDAFSVLASKIGQINTGTKYAIGNAKGEVTVKVSDLDFCPDVVCLYTNVIGDNIITREIHVVADNRMVFYEADGYKVRSYTTFDDGFEITFFSTIPFHSVSWIAYEKGWWHFEKR